MTILTPRLYFILATPLGAGHLGKADPVQTGEKIAQVFRDCITHQPSMGLLWQRATKVIGLDATSPLYKAGRFVASAMDRGHGLGIKDGFHNKDHFAQVLMSAAQLVLRNNQGNHDDITLTPHEGGQVLLTALGHDFFYEPGGNGETPYRLEAISFRQLEYHLSMWSVAAADQSNIQTMIYGTDVSFASRAGAFIRQAHHYHFADGEEPVVTETLQPVQAVLTDPRLSRKAALLVEADILGSAGLTVEYSREQNNKLGVEFGRPLGAKAIIWFIDNIAEGRFTTAAAARSTPKTTAKIGGH